MNFFEINEISWNNTNDFFFATNGLGCILIMSYPELKPLRTIQAHTSNCISIEFDPTGKYFATGSADASVSLWDIDELVCVRSFSRLDWPVRALSFSHDGKMLASASEDLFIDIVCSINNPIILPQSLVETGQKVIEINCPGSTFTVAWHPSKYLLAYACGDRERNDKEHGFLRIHGFPNQVSSLK